MSSSSRIADEQTSSLGGWLFADLFLLIMVIGLASFSIEGNTGKPNARTTQAKEISSRSVLITGEVDAGDTKATASFRWGTSSTLTGDAQVSSAEGSPVEAGEKDVDVSARLEGLKPLTKYYFQLRAENSSGESAGGIQSFETLEEGCSNAPSFIKSPFEKRYTASSARKELLADLTKWTAAQEFVQPKVAVALIRAWTSNPSGQEGSANAKRFFNDVVLRSDPDHFDENTALEALQNQYLARGEFDVRLFFVEGAKKCD
jgi:hypothetical protein